MRYLLPLILVLSLLGQIPSSLRSQRAVSENIDRITAELDSAGFAIESPIFIRIFKEERTLELWIEQDDTFGLFREYPICAMSGELGPKTRQGDRQAPEGFYFVPPSAMHPTSTFHLSFNLGYPNSYDRYHNRTGSALMVHGNCVSIGCFAMTDPVIEEIWTIAVKAFEGGQPFFRVHIFPFRDMIESLRDDMQWYDFWANLADGYDYFEENKIPPNVTVRDGIYQFE